jgi:hypothetical protein
MIRAAFLSRLPLVNSVRELDSAPRRFLFFTAFNVVSWQCIVGPAMVLFARRIDMPATWVGFLISFMPFTTLLVVFTVPLVVRVGAKQLMLRTWLLRNLVITPVFLMPWVIRYGGNHWGWYLLLGSTLGFCVMRAIGSGGWFPWLHEVVPEEQRGLYFSTEAGSTQLINVGIILAQGLFLTGKPSVERFLVIYAVGIAAGLFSLKWMSRVPGGGGGTQTLSLWEGFAAYRIPLRDRAYLRFVITAALCFSAASWFGSAFVLFLRDILLLPERDIMLIMAAASFGVMLTIRAWGRFADHSGSGRAIHKTLTAHSLIALAFVLLEPGETWTRYALPPLTFLITIFGAAFWMAANRAMLNLVKETGRVAYTNLWSLGTALSLGITPIFVGICIHQWGLFGFHVCFIISGVSGLLCAAAVRWVVRDSGPVEVSLSDLVNPILPVRTLARIMWITLGLHESNRIDGT